MNARTMNAKIGVAEFNHQLSTLVKAAMEDGLMDVYQIQGSCLAAANFVDRCALDSARRVQQQELATKILPATTIPQKLK